MMGERGEIDRKLHSEYSNGGKGIDWGSQNKKLAKDALSLNKTRGDPEKTNVKVLGALPSLMNYRKYYEQKGIVKRPREMKSRLSKGKKCEIFQVVGVQGNIMTVGEEQHISKLKKEEAE
jgi:hypothetical protein